MNFSVLPHIKSIVNGLVLHFHTVKMKVIIAKQWQINIFETLKCSFETVFVTFNTERLISGINEIF